MEFHILGTLEIIGSDGEPIMVSSPKQRSLLLYLLVNRGQVCSADRILDSVWEDETPTIKTLQFHLSKLRDALEPERARGSDGSVIATAPGGYFIDSESITLDADDFESRVSHASETSKDHPLQRSSQLQAALEMWNGPALDDVSYLTFAQIEARRLEELRMHCLERRIDLDIEVGSAAELISELEVLVRQHPLREPFWGQLMLCLYRAGRQAEALRVYQEAHRTLGEELGLEPSSALRTLESQMLRQDAKLDPVRVNVEAGPGNLPARTSAFIGRSRDLASLRELLGQHRLVTLTGVGGVGKTSLALHLARVDVTSWREGAWLAELGPVSDPASVPDALASAIAFRPQFDEAMLDGIVKHLQQSSRLIIMDNCEHVIEAAASTADALLAACPDVRLLVTSREPLRLPGEIVWSLDPMETPTPTTITLHDPPDAVRLFADRAMLVDPTFELNRDTVGVVASICARLDGLPLAIELAAAPLRALSLADVADSLRNRFAVLVSGSRSALAHQRTVEATVGWSFDLLEADEQTLFTALGVFAGSFDRLGAEQVAVASGIEAHDVLSLLVGLVDKSMLLITRHRTGISYRMLATVQHFARLKLAGRADARAIASAHSNWAISLAEAANAGLFAGGSRDWIDRIHHARDDIELVLERSREQGSPETGMRLLAALEAFLVESGDHGGFLSAHALREDTSWVDRLLCAGEVPDDVLASVLSAQGFLLILQNDLAGAKSVLDRCLELCSTITDDERSATAKLFLAIAMWSDYDHHQ